MEEKKKQILGCPFQKPQFRLFLFLVMLISWTLLPKLGWCHAGHDHCHLQNVGESSKWIKSSKIGAWPIKSPQNFGNHHDSANRCNECWVWSWIGVTQKWMGLSSNSIPEGRPGIIKNHFSASLFFPLRTTKVTLPNHRAFNLFSSSSFPGKGLATRRPCAPAITTKKVLTWNCRSLKLFNNGLLGFFWKYIWWWYREFDRVTCRFLLPNKRRSQPRKVPFDQS